MAGKVNQKCVRMSDKVVRYIEQYRGDNFSEKLENYILDTEERREQLVQDWDRLQAEIGQKRRQLRSIRERVEKISRAEQRMQPFVNCLLDIFKEP